MVIFTDVYAEQRQVSDQEYQHYEHQIKHT